MHVVLFAPTYEVDALGDVAPLVTSTDLQFAVLVGVQPPVIECLEQHVGELGVADAVLRLHPALHRVPGHHLIDGHVLTDISEEVEHADLHRPVVVADELGTPLTWIEIDQSPQLAADPFDVGRQGLLIKKIAFLGATTGVTDHSRRTADQHDDVVSVVLEASHGQDTDVVTNVQARRRRIDPVIERDRPLIEAPSQRVDVGRVVDQPTSSEVVKN